MLEFQVWSFYLFNKVFSVISGLSGSTLLKLVKCSVAYSINFNNVASVLLLLPELFLIIAIMFYLCFLKNFNNFYLRSLFFYFILFIEFSILYPWFSLHAHKAPKDEFLLMFYQSSFFYFNGSFIVDTYAIISKFIIIIFLILIVIFSGLKVWDKPAIRSSFTYNQDDNSWYSKIKPQPTMLYKINTITDMSKSAQADMFIPILFFLFFSFFLLSAFDLFGAYLALEGVSLSLYTLTANTYHKRVSIEAAIKYFVFGGISNGIILFGSSIFFGLCGTLNYLNVNYLLNSFYFNLSSIIVYVGLASFLIVFWFKVAAFPCHMWSPDVYEGTWLPITAILVIIVKLLYFLFFFKIFLYVFFKLIYFWQPAMLLSSLGSLLIGSFGIIGQNRIKRFMAYSSINHISFILLGLACGTWSGLVATIAYLLIYSITLLLFFGFMLNIRCVITGRSLIYLSDFANLTKFSNVSAQGLLVTLFSIGGIPPLAGFFVKLYIYIEALSSGLYLFVFFSLIITIISMFYYLFFLKSIFFDKNLWSKLVYLCFSRKIISYIIYGLCGFLLVFISLQKSHVALSKKLAKAVFRPIAIDWFLSV